MRLSYPKKSALHICGPVTSEKELTQAWDIYAGSSFIQAFSNKEKKRQAVDSVYQNRLIPIFGPGIIQNVCMHRV